MAEKNRTNHNTITVTWTITTSDDHYGDVATDEGCECAESLAANIQAWADRSTLDYDVAVVITDWPEPAKPSCTCEDGTAGMDCEHVEDLDFHISRNWPEWSFEPA